MERVEDGTFSIEQVVRKTSHAPAILYQVAERGFLREGYFADFTLIAPNTSEEDEPVLSKCGWSPFSGYPFKHRVAGHVGQRPPTLRWPAGHRRPLWPGAGLSALGSKPADLERKMSKWKIAGISLAGLVLAGWVFVNSPLMMAAFFYFIAPSQSFAEDQRHVEPDYTNPDYWAARPDKDSADVQPNGFSSDASVSKCCGFFRPSHHLCTERPLEPAARPRGYQ